MTVEISIRHVYGSVSFLGLCFCFIFTGYQVSQSFVTTMYQSAGYTALAIIYSTFAVSSLIAPTVCSMMGEKLTMILSGVTYVVFIMTLYSGNITAVLIGSFIKGCGSGLLWISQGTWLSKLLSAYRDQEKASIAASAPGKRAPSNIIGISTGIFFFIYNLNSILGNLLVVALMGSGFSIGTMILAMAFVTAFGTILIAFLSPNSLFVYPIQMTSSDSFGTQTEPSQGAPFQTENLGSKTDLRDTSTKSQIWDRLRGVLRLAAKPQTLYLMPYFFCQGVNMSYNYGNFPTFITLLCKADNSEVSSNTAAVNIAYAFLAYGFGALSGSFGWGKLYDIFNSKIWPLLISHFVLVLTGFSLLACAVIVQLTAAHVMGILMFCAFVFGSVDFLTNAIINNSITSNYSGNDVPVVFSWYRFCYCVGFAAASLLSSILPEVSSYTPDQASLFDRYSWLLMIVINISFMILSVTFGYLLQRGEGKVAMKQGHYQYMH